MRIRRVREPYSAFLPPVACERSMAQRVAEIAKRDKISQAEIIRQAVALFLQNIDRKSGDKGSKNA